MLHKIQRGFVKLLEKVGLTTLARAEAADKRAENAEAFSKIMVDTAGGAGDLIVAGDYTSIQNDYFLAGRRVIVAPGTKYVLISGCCFADGAA